MSDRTNAILRTANLTALAMLAFAANSLICRSALGHDLIDAGSFTAIRILAGAIALFAIARSRATPPLPRPDWLSVGALCCYMVFFSFAYLTLSAATGALLLFGAVQLTMFLVAIRQGERFAALAWSGLALAFVGLVYLMAPGLAAPDPAGAMLMTIAGIAWGAYSLLGRKAAKPLLATTSNFVYSLPVAVLIAIATLVRGAENLSGNGILLAAASGALASGIGYAVWYAALRLLRAGHAATVQLSVPIIAAIGGVLLLDEPLSPRLAIAAAMTLGGIWLVLTSRDRRGLTR